jgi:Zn/Cd-binding protein ZinT
MEQLETHGYFVNASGEKSTDLVLKNPQFHDHVIQPKKPRTSYIFFFKEESNKQKSKDPSLKTTEIAKICGSIWKDLSQDDIVRFQQMSEEDHSRYENEKRQLLTVGYFINSQGVKSTDLQVSQKKLHVSHQSQKSEKSTAPTMKSNSKVSVTSFQSLKK